MKLVVKEPVLKNSFYWRYFSPPLYIIAVTAILYTGYTYIEREPVTRDFEEHLPSSSDLYQRSNNATEPKVILFWTKFFGKENPFLRDRMSGCPATKCLLTDDRRYLDNSSAIVFHIRDLQRSDLPSRRNPSQLFVFFLLESPAHTFFNLDVDPWLDFFNLTFTYRWDSDAFCPFYLHDRFNAELWYYRNETRINLEKKLNRALIFLSNCGSLGGRDSYIADLQKYFPVDVFGSCGNRSCPRGDINCEKHTTAAYKFYLSFENRWAPIPANREKGAKTGGNSQVFVIDTYRFSPMQLA